MKDYLLVLIYANWCGHCVNYKAVDKDGKSNWDRVKEAVKGDNNNVDVFEFESSVLEPFTELKENGKGTTKEDFNKKCGEIIKNKFEEFEKVKKSGSVDKNDLADLINDYDLLNKINIYDLLSFRGFPTLMVMKNENGIYNKYSDCNVNRNDGKAVSEFIKKCISGEIDKKDKQEGGNKRDYRKKYKKYKTMYARLVNKYNLLKKEIK